MIGIAARTERAVRGICRLDLIHRASLRRIHRYEDHPIVNIVTLHIKVSEAGETQVQVKVIRYRRGKASWIIQGTKGRTVVFALAGLVALPPVCRFILKPVNEGCKVSRFRVVSTGSP